MAVAGRLIVCFVALCECCAGTNDPFPPGFSMSGMGAISRADGPEGRDVFTPASRYGDTLTLGVSTFGTLYYDRMDNFSRRSITQAGIGVWYRIRPLFVTVKGSYARMSALDVYFEDTGMISAATDALRVVTIGIDLSAYRTGITMPAYPARSRVVIGESLWYPLRFAAVSFQAIHLRLARAEEDTDKSQVFRLGLHTRRNRLGAQGAIVELKHDTGLRVCVTVGEELALSDRLAVAAAFASSPLRLGVGLTVTFPRWSAFGALAYDPVLGWSKGCGAEWMR